MAKDTQIAKALVFQKIQYSQCWEDPVLHHKAFRLAPGKNILAIASAGDNAFAHLLEDPARVLAVDFNATQIALAELKKAAILNLDWKACIGFLGERHSDQRWEIYRDIRSSLPQTVRSYWDSHRPLIERGVIHVGQFEKYFQTFQRYVLPFVHSRSTCFKVFEHKSLEEQQEFYHKRWNNWRGKLLFRIFFNEYFMSRLGRSKEQFAHVEAKNISRQFLERSELAFCKLPASENIFLQYILLAYHPHLEHLHPYLQQENFDVIKQRLHRLEFRHTSLGSVLEELEINSFHAFNLSDIFEYLDEDSFVEMGEKLHQAASADAVFSYWNFLVPRRLSAVLPHLFRQDKELSHELWMQDRAFVYGDYVVDYVRPQGLGK